MQISELMPGQLKQCQEMLMRDVVAGGLIHSLLLRHGLAGQVKYWGLWAGKAGVSCLDGVISLEGLGRATICGGGPLWVGQVVELIGAWRAGAVERFASFDASDHMADALAVRVPPLRRDPLTILAYDEAVGAASDEFAFDIPGQLLLREATSSDAAALTRLYGAEEGFSWVDVSGILSMCRDGHRLWAVGEVDGEIVTAGWANTLEPTAARLSGIVTLPERRRYGYATALTGALARWLLDAGRRPYLYVAVGDPAANAVYHKLGFRRHSERVNLIYEAEDR